MRWSGILTDNSTFFLYHDKKDTFAVHGTTFRPKSAHINFSFHSKKYQKKVDYEQTSTTKFLTIRERPPLRWSPCRSF